MRNEEKLSLSNKQMKWVEKSLRSTADIKVKKFILLPLPFMARAIVCHSRFLVEKSLQASENIKESCSLSSGKVLFIYV